MKTIADKLSKKEILDLIYTTFRRMERICESTREWDVYFDMQIESEREHRKHAPEGSKFGISVRETAQLYSVRHVFQALANIGYQAKAKDFFSIKKEVFGGAAIADIKNSDLMAVFTLAEMQFFMDNVNYVELIKVD